MLLTNVVRAVCIAIDAAFLTAGAVALARAAVRLHRRRTAVVRRACSEPVSNVALLHGPR